MAVGKKAACCPCRRWRCPGPHLDRWQISSDQGQRDSRRMEEVPWGKLFDLDPGGRKLGHPEQKQEEGILECSGPSTDEETTDVACSGVRGAASGCVGAPEEWRFCGKSCRWRSLWRGRQRLACRGRLGSALSRLIFVLRLARARAGVPGGSLLHRHIPNMPSRERAFYPMPRGKQT